MGSPLGLDLASIFMVFHERRLLSRPNKPVVFFHFVDDMFCLCNYEIEADLFFDSLNKIHLALKFTVD